MAPIYTYGINRISQTTSADTKYFGGALGLRKWSKYVQIL
jgi:hypothetical protein